MPGIPAVCSLWIENSEAFIKRNARMMWRKTLNLREELPEYVERSCHEAQINYRQRNRLSGSSDCRKTLVGASIARPCPFAL